MVTFKPAPETEYDNSDTETWQPKKDSPEQILGTVTERKEVTRKDGTTAEFIKLDGNDNQTWLVWVSPTKLRECVVRDDPQPGDTWGVEYQGSKSIGQGRFLDLYGSYHNAAADKSSKTAAKAPKGYSVASGADAQFEPNDDEPF